MTFDIRQVDLDKLNSLTKYPSILTYHRMADKGLLRDEVQISFDGRVIGTEKVDGTNARMIFCPDGSVIVGSREDLLWERRDLIGNPALGIVAALEASVQRLAPLLCQPGHVAVYFGEVYGRNIGGAAKQYSREGHVGFRLFDVLLVENFRELLDWPVERIALWRDQGGQPFVSGDRLGELATCAGLETVPPLFDFDAAQLPCGLDETLAFVLSYEHSRCKLDNGAGGIPEGIVVRSVDRSRIAKIRREDYQRTLNRRTAKK